MKKMIAVLVVLGALTATSVAMAQTSDNGLCSVFNTDPSVRSYCEEQAAARASMAQTRASMAQTRTEIVESRSTASEAQKALVAVRTVKNECGCYSVPTCVASTTCVQVMCGGCAAAQTQVRVVRAGLSRSQVQAMIDAALKDRPTVAEMAALEKRLIAMIGELDGRVKALEGRISALEKEAAEDERRIAALEEIVKGILERLGKLELRVGALEVHDKVQDLRLDVAGEKFDIRLFGGGIAVNEIYAIGAGIGADFGMTDSLKLVLDASIGYSLDSALTTFGDLGLMWFSEREIFGIGGGALIALETVEDEKDFFLGVAVMLRLQQSRFEEVSGSGAHERKVRVFGQLICGAGDASNRWGKPDENGDRQRIHELGGGCTLVVGASFNP